MAFTDIIKIEIEIKNLRTQLINVGMEKGLTHPNTIQLSKNLDRLLNKYGTK